MAWWKWNADALLVRMSNITNIVENQYPRRIFLKIIIWPSNSPLDTHSKEWKQGLRYLHINELCLTRDTSVQDTWKTQICTLVIIVLRRLKQEDPRKFKGRLGYSETLKTKQNDTWRSAPSNSSGEEEVMQNPIKWIPASEMIRKSSAAPWFQHYLHTRPSEQDILGKERTNSLKEEAKYRDDYQTAVIKVPSLAAQYPPVPTPFSLEEGA